MERFQAQLITLADVNKVIEAYNSRNLAAQNTHLVGSVCQFVYKDFPTCRCALGAVMTTETLLQIALMNRASDAMSALTGSILTFHNSIEKSMWSSLQGYHDSWAASAESLRQSQYGNNEEEIKYAQLAELKFTKHMLAMQRSAEQQSNTYTPLHPFTKPNPLAPFEPQRLTRADIRKVRDGYLDNILAAQHNDVIKADTGRAVCMYSYPKLPCLRCAIGVMLTDATRLEIALHQSNSGEGVDSIITAGFITYDDNDEDLPNHLSYLQSDHDDWAQHTKDRTGNELRFVKRLLLNLPK